LYLKRGHIILIAGGAVAAVGFAVFVYLLSGNMHTIKPNESLTIQRFISSNASQGVYRISFPFFEGQPLLKIVGPANQTILEKNINPPLASEEFAITQGGNYTMILTNPSSDATLEAPILFGDRESFATLEYVSALVYAGVIAAIAGAVITVLDRRRTSKMKQFGDTSDLV
jgi:hypothetical protein